MDVIESETPQAKQKKEKNIFDVGNDVLMYGTVWYGGSI